MRRQIWMTALGWVIVTVMTATPARAQSPVAPGSFYAWDYLDADLVNGQVVRFEARLDFTTAWQNLGLPTPISSPTNPVRSYAVQLPDLTAGTHQLEVRACNTTGCGVALFLEFAYLTSTPPPPPPPIALPAAPFNLRIIPPGV